MWVSKLFISVILCWTEQLKPHQRSWAEHGSSVHHCPVLPVQYPLCDSSALPCVLSYIFYSVVLEVMHIHKQHIIAWFIAASSCNLAKCSHVSCRQQGFQPGKNIMFMNLHSKNWMPEMSCCLFKWIFYLALCLLLLYMHLLFQNPTDNKIQVCMETNMQGLQHQLPCFSEGTPATLPLTIYSCLHRTRQHQHHKNRPSCSRMKHLLKAKVQNEEHSYQPNR